MSKRFWVLSAAAVVLGLPCAALAQPQGPEAPALPDFPPDAEPGACYARVRGDGPAAPVSGPGVWTLKRGHGPEAVWSYSEPGATAQPGASADGYRWVRVLCGDGQTPFGGETYAHRGPATGTTGAGLEPPAPLVIPPPPPVHVPPPPPVVEPPLPEGPHHAPFHHPLPPHEGGPMHQAGPMHGPGPQGPHVFLFERHHAEGAGAQFHGPPPPPPPLASPPRWFGDRYLHWAGKRPPAW
ncbi:MAG TPA: hypothetical protein VF699_01815 [Caulobacteraceae bacterium]|jgi:hypothetical protein